MSKLEPSAQTTLIFIDPTLPKLSESCYLGEIKARVSQLYDGFDGVSLLVGAETLDVISLYSPSLGFSFMLLENSQP